MGVAQTAIDNRPSTRSLAGVFRRGCASSLRLHVCC